MRKFLIIIFLLLFSISGFTEENKKKPLKAAALSLLIPGGGQFYNESYWKSSGVFLLESYVIGLATYHHLKAEDYYQKYAQTENPENYSKYLEYYNKRQSDFFWVGTVVFLSMIDAFVDAHLFDFETKKKKIHLKFGENTISLSYRF
ncbi:MAG TPA: hypothetical protein ENL20_00085 [Candidatus Cloacimonetes bacterium]|nr:hypothetical protein [Candidatus Cloacimonadota bacterium]